MLAPDYPNGCSAPWQVCDLKDWLQSDRAWAIVCTSPSEPATTLYLYRDWYGFYSWGIARGDEMIAAGRKSYLLPSEAEKSLFAALPYAWVAVAGGAPIVPQAREREPLRAYWQIYYLPNSVRGFSWEARLRGGPISDRGTRYIVYDTASLITLLRHRGATYPVVYGGRNCALWATLAERLTSAGIVCLSFVNPGGLASL